ncbi:hypothetical protein UFOVP817_21 [uncultured Caudovirales phage]|uniref:Uncharacterized protein n=1 Tax=uncultured Caudovirales phage TaxID=2100421 RepID=A0A6J5P700_9CAUD|nr:hypothetical protein UFOVP817_21 [uncultured Caudovirales phage]
MTIDPTDYEPRPADDFAAAMNSLGFFKIIDTLERFTERDSEIWRGINTSEERCNQLGCDFSDLPHG